MSLVLYSIFSCPTTIRSPLPSPTPQNHHHSCQCLLDMTPVTHTEDMAVPLIYFETSSSPSFFPFFSLTALIFAEQEMTVLVQRVEKKDYPTNGFNTHFYITSIPCFSFCHCLMLLMSFFIQGAGLTFSKVLLLQRRLVAKALQQDKH